eukprot:363066-Chlamydomonas_euryale.AAC.8
MAWTQVEDVETGVLAPPTVLCGRFTITSTGIHADAAVAAGQSAEAAAHAGESAARPCPTMGAAVHGRPCAAGGAPRTRRCLPDPTPPRPLDGGAAEPSAGNGRVAGVSQAEADIPGVQQPQQLEPLQRPHQPPSCATLPVPDSWSDLVKAEAQESVGESMLFSVEEVEEYIQLMLRARCEPACARGAEMVCSVRRVVQRLSDRLSSGHSASPRWAVCLPDTWQRSRLSRVSFKEPEVQVTEPAVHVSAMPATACWVRVPTHGFRHASSLQSVIA